MKTNPFGSLIEFGALKPSDLFVCPYGASAPLAVAGHFKGDDKPLCVVFDEFGGDSFDEYAPVWKLEGTCCRPAMDPKPPVGGATRPGALVLASDGLSVVCLDRRNSVMRIHLETGVISSSLSDPRLVLSAWEIVVEASGGLSRLFRHTVP